MTIETITARSAERHTHESGSISAEEALLCPTCNQSVSQEQFEQIQVRIEGEERARAAKIERTLQTRFASEMAKVEATKKAEVEKARKDAAAQIEKIKQEAAKVARAALAPKIAEAEKAKKAAEAKVKEIRTNQDVVIAQRLAVQRETLAKQMAEAVNGEKVKAFEEKTKLTQQLAELQRRVESKTAHELGEPAEFDLYETLRAEFRGDQISRVGKGMKGPDIIVAIVHNGVLVGKIVLDSKNHRRWANRFTEKLRSDQLTEGADFAILSSSTFPRGAKQLHIQDNVIVTDPARVVVLMHLLRRQILQSHALKLGSEGRNEKASRLLDFIVSPVCTDLLDQIVKLTEELFALDVKETYAHQATWKKRGELIGAVRKQHDQMAEAISRITTGSEASA